MFALPPFRPPASRAQAVTEMLLAALLAAQPVLWVWTLAGPGDGQAGAAALTVTAPRMSIGSGGGDPFFRAAGDALPLSAHTLYAVRAGADAGAILAGPDGVQKAVRLGETVSDGVVLAAVAADHVVLTHGQARTRLDFPASPPPPPASHVQPAMAAAPASAGQAGAGAGEAATYATALRPVSANGADGYVWRPGTDGGVLAAAGLRPGDVILRINGTPFDRAERLEELAADIAGGHAVELEYRRNGSVFSSRYAPE